MLHWRKSILHSADVSIKYFCSTDWRTSSFLHKPLIDFWSCYLPTMTSWPPFYTGFCLDLLGGPVCGPWWSEPRGAQGSFIFIMRGGLPNLTTLCSCVCFMEDTRRLIFTPQRRFIYLFTLTRYLKVFHCEINLWLQNKPKTKPSDVEECRWSIHQTHSLREEAALQSGGTADTSALLSDGRRFSELYCKIIQLKTWRQNIQNISTTG